MVTPSSTIHKVFCVANIKTHVPIILDIDKLNYDAWRELFYTHCQAYDADEHLDGINAAPNDAEWKKVDAVIKGWIYSTITQNTLTMIIKNSNTSNTTLWCALEHLFRDNKDARAIQLDTELRNITMGDLSVTAYCAKIKSIADLLENLDAANKVPDKNLVIYTLSGLTSRFENISGIIRDKDPFPTFSEARSMLLAEEQRHTYSRNKTYAPLDNSSSPSILYAGGQSIAREKSRQPNHRRQDHRPLQQRHHDRRYHDGNRNQPPPPRYGWVYIVKSRGGFNSNV
ncbi:hypothetical protein OROGR_008211 [Orobanche gracilis]